MSLLAASIVLILSSPFDDRAAIDAVVFRAIADSYVKGGYPWQEKPMEVSEILGIRKSYSMPDRPDFAEKFSELKSELIEGLKSVEQRLSKEGDSKERTRLRTYAAQAEKCLAALSGIDGKSGSAPSPDPLAKLELGPNVKLTDMDRYARDKGSVVGLLSVTPPTYNATGNVALVSATFPWSIHHGKILFLLKAKGTGWMLASWSVVYYV